MVRAGSLLVMVALVGVGCGEDSQSAQTVTETSTVTVTETITQTAAVVTTAKANPAAAAPTKSAKAERDPAEKEHAYYMKLDDAAIALDMAVGGAIDGDESSIAAVARQREKISDLNYDWAADGGGLWSGAQDLSNAAASADAAAQAGEVRRLVELRQDIMDARDAITKKAMGKE